MENLFNHIKNIYQKVNLKFVSLYEDKMIKIIEFSEYIDKTLSTIENLNVYSDENMFIENYENFINIKNISDKYYKSIITLKEIIIKYKEFLESYKEKGNTLADYMKKGIEVVKIKNVDKVFETSTELNQILINDLTANKQQNDISNINNKFNNTINKKNWNDISMNMNTSRDNNQSINLKFLFTDKKLKRINSLNSGTSFNFQKRNSFLKDKKKTNDNSININLDKMKDNPEQNFRNKTQNGFLGKIGSSNISSNSGSNNIPIKVDIKGNE